MRWAKNVLHLSVAYGSERIGLLLVNRVVLSSPTFPHQCMLVLPHSNLTFRVPSLNRRAVCIFHILFSRVAYESAFKDVKMGGGKNISSLYSCVAFKSQK